jgi:hypothetical protein
MISDHVYKVARHICNNVKETTSFIRVPNHDEVHFLREKSDHVPIAEACRCFKR